MTDEANYIKVNSKNLYGIMKESPIGTFLHFLNNNLGVIISNDSKQAEEREVKILENTVADYQNCMKIKDYLLKDNKAELVHYEVFFENNSLYNTYKNLYENFEEKLN